MAEPSTYDMLALLKKNGNVDGCAVSPFVFQFILVINLERTFCNLIKGQHFSLCSFKRLCAGHACLAKHFRLPVKFEIGSFSETMN